MLFESLNIKSCIWPLYLVVSSIRIFLCLFVITYETRRWRENSVYTFILKGKWQNNSLDQSWNLLLTQTCKHVGHKGKQALHICITGSVQSNSRNTNLGMWPARLLKGNTRRCSRTLPAAAHSQDFECPPTLLVHWTSCRLPCTNNQQTQWLSNVALKLIKSKRLAQPRLIAWAIHHPLHCLAWT